MIWTEDTGESSFPWASLLKAVHFLLLASSEDLRRWCPTYWFIWSDLCSRRSRYIRSIITILSPIHRFISATKTKLILNWTLPIDDGSLRNYWSDVFHFLVRGIGDVLQARGLDSGKTLQLGPPRSVRVKRKCVHQRSRKWLEVFQKWLAERSASKRNIKQYASTTWGQGDPRATHQTDTEHLHPAANVDQYYL